MPVPSVTFISSLHNCLPHTRAMLSSLAATVDLANHQLVLVDDASSDGTPDFLQTLAQRPEITVIENAENRGFAASNNIAVAAARHPILLFINNDLEFSGSWLPPMLDALKNAPKAGAVGNVQRNFATGLVDHAGIFFDLDGLPTHAHKNRRNPPSGTLIQRNAVTAACMAIEKEIFLGVGGFDETYRNGCEDVDLCMKLKGEGYHLYVALESIVRHHISVSPGRNKYNDYNTQIFRKKWAKQSSKYGQQEWPKEYYRRYARYWWRMNPRLAAKALVLLATGRS
ncbi:glycosyltransferase family 2 protein [Pelagicoccus sp. SDUM812002]|uniref:glycosyltransferase family 2 protein n=1 Tax=Pelagicoccus sp. SDUM812002 TaxID=3041266 RepID=UPI00280C9EE9|nr:glycosyltransferase family 2 protein [Pelagicoccus sp. SDUM812002]MDQ8184557.1 glycosyltransferase family 2 protein [Pelagicoccus sp. SDUM812002]